MEISSVSSPTRVRSWTEVNDLGFTILHSVVNAPNKGNFSVLLIKKLYKSGQGPQSLVTLGVGPSCSLQGKQCFMTFLVDQGEGGASTQNTMQARSTAVIGLPSPRLTTATPPPIHQDGYAGREALSPGALPESSTSQWTTQKHGWQHWVHVLPSRHGRGAPHAATQMALSVQVSAWTACRSFSMDYKILIRALGYITRHHSSQSLRERKKTVCLMEDIRLSWASPRVSQWRIHLKCRRHERDEFNGVEKIPLEKETATHSSILAWEIPQTQEPGGLYSP